MMETWLDKKGWETVRGELLIQGDFKARTGDSGGIGWGREQGKKSKENIQNGKEKKSLKSLDEM